MSWEGEAGWPRMEKRRPRRQAPLHPSRSHCSRRRYSIPAAVLPGLVSPMEDLCCHWRRFGPFLLPMDNFLCHWRHWRSGGWRNTAPSNHYQWAVRLRAISRKARASGREPRATGSPVSPLSRMPWTSGIRPSRFSPKRSAIAAPPSFPKR